MRRVVPALRCAFGFLTRLPVRTRAGDRDWAAFRSSPWTLPLVGWVVGALAAIPLLAAGTLPAPTVALGYLLAVYILTGIHHVDGVADLGDAMVVHGDRERRLDVLKDTTTGVGGLLGVSVVAVGVALAGLELAGLPVLVAVGVAIAAEVGAKVGMAVLACFGEAGREGMGSQLTDAATPRMVTVPAVLALPVVALTWSHPAAAAAVVGALVGACLPWFWARRALGGVTGDVFGAANELGRLVGLHAGVIAWTLW